MASASDSAVFIIYHREKSGKPDRIYAYEEEEARYLLRVHPLGWYKRWNPKEVVDKFVGVMLENFPLLFVDDGFLTPNVAACHWRRKYDQFFARDQGIGLQRVRDMCAAAKKAMKSNDSKSKDNQQYRIFIFLFAITFFHELGHVFITFVSLGDGETPEELTPDMVDAHKRDKPESGWALEQKAFGGVVMHGFDDDYDETQPGAPHLVTGKRVGRIPQQIVDEFIKCNFQVLPFDASEDATSDPLRGIGEGDGDTVPLPTDPLKYSETFELKEKHTSNPFDWGDLKNIEPSISTHEKVQVPVGAQSVLAQIAFRPDLRIETIE